MIKRPLPTVDRTIMLVGGKNRLLSRTAEAICQVVHYQAQRLAEARKGNPLFDSGLDR